MKLRDFLESEQAAREKLDKLFAKHPDGGEDFDILEIAGNVLSPDAWEVFKESIEPSWEAKKKSKDAESWRVFIEACVPLLQKAWLIDHPKKDETTNANEAIRRHTRRIK